MGAKAFYDQSTSSQAGLGAMGRKQKVARPTRRGGVERLLPQCRFIYFFPSPCQVETKNLKNLYILGTNEYINMILFVKIKNFIVTCVSVLNK